MDPISNMLTNIRNSLSVNKESCISPFSKINFSIALILKNNGFINDFKKEMEKNEKFKNIKIFLKYNNELLPAITEIKRISRLGRRVYIGYNEIRMPRFGIIILSTPQGVMTSIEAKKRRIGGEVICSVR